MKAHILLGSMAAGGMIAASPALAQTAPPAVTIGITAGTLGVGPEVGVRIAPVVGLRGSATFLDISHDIGVDDITYNGKLKLVSYGANVDLYPFGGGLRVSGGFRIDRNKVGITATPTRPVTVGDATFTPEQIGTLTGTVRAENEFVPTLTLGYAGGLTKGLKFGIDGGIMFQGRPRIDDLKANGSLSTNPTFLAELAKEEQDIEDDVSKYKLYPIVQVSLFYAF